MSLPLLFTSLSALIYLIGFVPYIYHAFHGKVVPHPFSWTIWAILSTINTLAILHVTGVSYELISPIVSTTSLSFGAVVGWLMFHKIHVNSFDYLCLSLAIVVIFIAYLFSVSQAIIPSVIVDLIVLSPTLKKIWNNPESEDISGWIGAGSSRLLFLFALGVNAFSFSSFWWWYSVVINFAASVFIVRRTLYMKNWIHKARFFLQSLL